MERAELARALGRAAPGLRPDLLAQFAGEELVFLDDPAWGAADRQQFAALTGERAEAPPGGEGWLLIPSGGTSGRLKLARHDQRTIGAAVAGFAAHFRAREVSSVGVLPLHHVSGLIAWVRCALTGGQYVPWDWKRLEGGEAPAELPPAALGRLRTISLVPTQLQRLITREAAVDWLRRFDVIFVGGGAPWPGLLDAAAAARLPLSIGYGMTETAAMACGQLPGEFLAGDRSSGRPLPHIRLELAEGGVPRLSGPSLFKGYFPVFDRGQTFTTDDLVTVDPGGRVTVLGRRDAVITTGGKKVDAAEVEAALRATGFFSDLAVLGLPDSEWGQVIVLCHPASDGAIAPAQIAAALDNLSPYKRPRRVVQVVDWPRTAQGKLNRAALAVWVSEMT